MKKYNSKIWPYSIGVSIILVFTAAMATIAITNERPIEMSDTYMMGYHEADAKANEIIKSRIAFNKKYKIKYITDTFNENRSIIRYKIVDLDENPIDNAKIKVIITRPNNHKYDMELDDAKVKDGVYIFKVIKLPVAGRWDIMAKVNIDKYQRFFNVKADTRLKRVYEY